MKLCHCSPQQKPRSVGKKTNPTSTVSTQSAFSGRSLINMQNAVCGFLKSDLFHLFLIQLILTESKKTDVVENIDGLFVHAALWQYRPTKTGPSHCETLTLTGRIRMSRSSCPRERESERDGEREGERDNPSFERSLDMKILTNKVNLFLHTVPLDLC